MIASLRKWLKNQSGSTNVIKDMIEKFGSLFQARSFLSTLESLIEHFSEDYVKDNDLKNALIDEVCEFLQAQKDK